MPSVLSLGQEVEWRTHTGTVERDRCGYVKMLLPFFMSDFSSVQFILI